MNLRLCNFYRQIVLSSVVIETNFYTPRSQGLILLQNSLLNHIECCMCMCEVCYDAESRRETGVWGPDLRDHHRKSTKVRKKEVGCSRLRLVVVRGMFVE